MNSFIKSVEHVVKVGGYRENKMCFKQIRKKSSGAVKI